MLGNQILTDTYLGQPKRISRYFMTLNYQGHQGHLILKTFCLNSIFWANCQILANLAHHSKDFEK